MSVSSAWNVDSSRLIVPTVSMWLDGGSIDPSGTNGTIGAQSAFPSLRAMALQLVFSTKLCLPSASHGPFGSIPPVEMMTVVLPAFTASRTSIHVMSSIHTVSGGVSGLGVSAQLYGLAMQLPPPRLRGSAGGR